MKLRKKDVKEFLKITYPNYNGRKFILDFQKSYTMENYWDGGTKKEIMALTLHEDGKVQAGYPSYKTTCPYNEEAHKKFDIPNNVMLVEHCIFCGKDIGIYFIISHNSDWIQKMIKEK